MATEHVIQQQIETPAAATSVFTLPAGYLDENGQVHREIVVREMTGYEEDILASGADALKKLNEIQARCLMRIGEISDKERMPKIVRDLPVGDRIFLLIAIRRVTLGDAYPFTFRCPKCSHEAQMSLDLASLEVRGLEDPAVRTKEVALPSGRTAVFHIPTGRDEERFSSPSSDTSLLTRAVLLRLDTINGKPVSLADVKALPSRDLQALRREYEKFDVGVDTTIEIECPSCFEEFKTEMEIQPSFFFPSET